jgi:hypothetical protein
MAIKIRDLTSSQECWWRFKDSEIWRRVDLPLFWNHAENARSKPNRSVSNYLTTLHIVISHMTLTSAGYSGIHSAPFHHSSLQNLKIPNSEYPGGIYCYLCLGIPQKNKGRKDERTKKRTPNGECVRKSRKTSVITLQLPNSESVQ